MSIIAVGPRSKVLITGQAAAFELLVPPILDRGGIIIDTNYETYSSINKILKDLVNFSRIIRLFFDKQHSFFYLSIKRSFLGAFPWLLLLFISRYFGVKSTVHVHGNSVVWERYACLALCLKRSNLILISENQMDVHRKLGLSHINLIKNPSRIGLISKSAFVKKDLDISAGHRAPRILYFSNVMEEKGVFEMVDGAVRLEADGEEFELNIYGAIFTSKLVDKALSLISESRQVSYLGVVSDVSRVAAIFDYHDWIVLPSRYPIECAPLAIIEAYCRGLRICISNINGIDQLCVPDEIITNVTSSSLKKHLESMVSDMRHQRDVEEWYVNALEFSSHDHIKSVLDVIY